MTIAYPPRVALARTPTPLDLLQRTSDALGVEVYLKRDDLTGIDLTGNKVRKLEFLLAEALEQGADMVITCGGAQSNHCRATALAATRLGLGSLLLLRTDDPSRPPPVEGNILLDRLAGAEIVWITPAEYARREETWARHADRLRAAGKRPYVIPEGGSNELGAWGYIACVDELARDLAALPARPTTIVHATGSGGTSAGLILGVRMTGLCERGVGVAGVNVCDDRAYFVRVIGEICARFRTRWPSAPVVGPADIDVVDGYVGRGYARSSRDELVVLRDLARREGVILDPVYTGKAFFGLTRELARDPRRFGERVVFVHTGGIFGLFPQAAELASLV
jgi:D-cysteine desulfhydrase